MRSSCLLLVLLSIVYLSSAQRTHVTCERKYKKFGCFAKDPSMGKRLFSERLSIDWDNYTAYIHSFACRCNEAAIKNGDEYFSIFWYGECFGSASAPNPAAKLSSDKCKSHDFKKCSHTDIRECSGDDQSHKVYRVGKKVDGGLSQWTAYGACSRSCGGGVRSRQRSCNNPAPANGGRDCVGPLTETQACGTTPCKVDGGFSQWTAYGACSRSCGGGVRSRRRSCNDPAPAHGGRDCVGPRTETQACATAPCKVDGGLSHWTAYGACSRSCGGGVRSRQRSCNNPAPAHGGRDCVGPRTETQACGTAPCKVDGGLSQWTAYGACSKSCGGGVRSRRRSCNNPAPAHGGRDCVGPLTETQSCKNQLCPGPAAVAEAQGLVEDFLKNYHKAVFPDKQILGKFSKAILVIQEAVAKAFQTETSEESLATRLKHLKDFLKVAANGGSIDFARTTLGTSLFVLMKKKIEEGLPITDLDRAARGYLDSLRKDLGSKLDDILLVNGNATLMFAIDTTRSMADDINGAKAIAEYIIRIKREFPVNFILSPFNDPGAGPVTKKDSQHAIEFIRAIERLVVQGGGDCHEMAFKGMRYALTSGPAIGSPLFVFTDAGPKDDTERAKKQVLAFTEAGKISVTFFTHPLGCNDAKGIQSFRDVAKATSGSVIPLTTTSELFQYKDFMANSLENMNTIAQATISTRRRGRRSGSNNYRIEVDEEMKSLMVTINVQQENVGNAVELVDRAGRTYFAQSSTRFAKVFNIKNPDPGTWSLRYRFGIGEVAFTADAVSDKPLDFYYYFNHQEKPSENSPVMALPNPIQGRKASMAVRVSNVELLNPASLKIDIVDEHGSVLVGNVAANRMGGGAFEASFDPPSSQFKVMLKGRTTKGRTFQRLSNRFSKVEKIVMVAISAGNEFTASATRGASTVRVYVYNSGFIEYLQFSGSASRGSISGSNHYFLVKKGEGKIFELQYTVNRSGGPHVGKTDTIFITAKGPGRQEMVPINVLIVE